MNNKSRKNRGGPVRNQRPHRPVVSEGVYNNAHFMHAATAQVGNVVRITTASGIVWEGVFKTFSSRFDVVLEVAAKVENPDGPNAQIDVDTYVDKLIFKPCDILTMVAQDVDLEYPTRDTFLTDTAISAPLNGNMKLEEKKLEPWDASGMNGADIELELDQANGWDANDMFRKNEQDYGVQSTFDQSLRGYTVPLQTSDSADYKEAEAKANLIANEIENQPQHKARLELENGDEEAIYAAVVRPHQENNTNGKYIPPAKRKNQNSGKLVRSTPPPSQSSSSQNTPSPKETRPPMSYPTHPSPHQNNVHLQRVALPQNPPHMHNATIHSPPMGIQPHPAANHSRPHAHTPPHQYQQPPVPQRQPNIPQQLQQQQQQQAQQQIDMSKAQINGEAKGAPPARQQRVYQNQQYQSDIKPEVVQIQNHPARHRDDTIKDLHQFAQDFKLAGLSNEQPPPQVVEQIPPVQNIPNKPPQQPSPPQPQQSISPQQDNLDKVANTLKKSTLNPNAKEFVLNPTAKPFQPRSPSTPSASRPHTPQTPSHSPYVSASVGGPAVQQAMPVMMPFYHVMTSQPQYQTPPQGNKIRRLPMRADMASQMQVAAATGQPLLAPAPMQQFIYPPTMNQAYQPMHMAVRTYETSPQIQYLPPNAHPVAGAVARPAAAVQSVAGAAGAAAAVPGGAAAATGPPPISADVSAHTGAAAHDAEHAVFATGAAAAAAHAGADAPASRPGESARA
ncbi:unnamed protein product [Phyllotreta striolata]|uniref:LsmAD domain-containing protein n=1 Tax=Phyllotreta striolata TaxID=444603 RepID=A0A9N9TSD9_PHYSR|nr:unnamed protein product [Phyllotreta striolata]